MALVGLHEDAYVRACGSGLYEDAYVLACGLAACGQSAHGAGAHMELRGCMHAQGKQGAEKPETELSNHVNDVRAWMCVDVRV